MTEPATGDDLDQYQDDNWSPSDGHWTIRQAIAEARAGIQAGKKRFAARQALIDQRHARHDQGDK